MFLQFEMYFFKYKITASTILLNCLGSFSYVTSALWQVLKLYIGTKKASKSTGEIMINSCEQGFPSKTNFSKTTKEEYLNSDGIRGVKREAHNHTVLHLLGGRGKEDRMTPVDCGTESPGRASFQGRSAGATAVAALLAREQLLSVDQRSPRSVSCIFRDPSAAPTILKGQNYKIPLQLS